MSCLGPKYNPVPTREWARFQGLCLVNSSVSPDEAYNIAVLKKGNILQYKNNSSQITKWQRYSQIAKGAWTNRTTTWASQTETYTNPNTRSLKRVNYIGTLGPDSIYDPRVCPGPFIPTSYSSLPSTGGQGTTGPVAPIIPPEPPGPTGPGGPVLPPLTPVPVEPDVVIPEGGSLVCNIIENICTGEIFSQTEQNFCNPTSSSDVPGPIQLLCYDDSMPTYYPKTKLTYGTSDNKWPIGAKFILPA